MFQVNEAFAPQFLAVAKELGLDPARTNVNGGAIALGHPLGASGARITTSLVHEIRSVLLHFCFLVTDLYLSYLSGVVCRKVQSLTKRKKFFYYCMSGLTKKKATTKREKDKLSLNCSLITSAVMLFIWLWCNYLSLFPFLVEVAFFVLFFFFFSFFFSFFSHFCCLLFMSFSLLIIFNFISHNSARNGRSRESESARKSLLAWFQAR